MGRLNLLSGVIGANNLKRETDSHHKNREAEESYVRRTVWGSEEAETPEDESMRDTVLGDIIHPTPIIYPPKQSSIMPALLGTLVGAGIPLALLAGYMLSQPDDSKPPKFDDESVNVGLGRIEDYFPSAQ
jgi:hypothetical protein